MAWTVFFCKQIKEAQTLWNERLNSIHFKVDPYKDYTALEKFGGLLLIDNLVKTYPSYTHEKVFRMEVDFAYTLLMINKTEGSIQAQANETRRKVKKKP